MALLSSQIPATLYSFSPTPVYAPTSLCTPIPPPPNQLEAPQDLTHPPSALTSTSPHHTPRGPPSTSQIALTHPTSSFPKCLPLISVTSWARPPPLRPPLPLLCPPPSHILSSLCAEPPLCPLQHPRFPPYSPVPPLPFSSVEASSYFYILNSLHHTPFLPPPFTCSCISFTFPASSVCALPKLPKSPPPNSLHISCIASLPHFSAHSTPALCFGVPHFPPLQCPPAAVPFSSCHPPTQTL